MKVAPLTSVPQTGGTVTIPECSRWSRPSVEDRYEWGATKRPETRQFRQPVPFGSGAITAFAATPNVVQTYLSSWLAQSSPNLSTE